MNASTDDYMLNTLSMTTLKEFFGIIHDVNRQINNRNLIYST